MKRTFWAVRRALAQALRLFAHRLDPGARPMAAAGPGLPAPMPAGAPSHEPPARPAARVAPGEDRHARGDADAAGRILAVADRLDNRELARRLRAAVAMLGAVDVVDPAVGDAYDPLVHQWAESRKPGTPADHERIAEVLAVGFTDASGAVVRPARVAVFDDEEQ
ncbi:nucleotide exchange factor GrpE [Actinomadura mexicana]|uniref:GrpE protein n=1 Tax=Actinomadura mexicana TaxID=134959 RepID=A0A239B0V3_9ACTN|nr:nucleotide exchange factor GrpE [Actinomadura mexicana]SNS00884.1 hypothetical protein SAMN06265355_109305 [Actinomadura mexicana]